MSRIKVLFVCLGNICRSPMAEAVLRHKLERSGLMERVEVDSAGTGDWHVGKPPHEGTQRILDRAGIDWAQLAARQVTGLELAGVDYIVALDASNAADLQQLAPAEASRVMRLLDLLPEQSLRDVPDPYYTGNFEHVYELVDAACERLLERIGTEHELPSASS